MPISAKPRRSYEEFFGNPHVSEGWILIHLQPASVSFRINATWQILTVTYSNPPKKSGTASIHFLVFVGFDSNFYLFWACLSGRLYQPLVPRDVETWRRRRQWLRDAERLKIWRSKDSQDVTICLRYVFYILYIYIYICLLVYYLFTVSLLFVYYVMPLLLAFQILRNVDVEASPFLSSGCCLWQWFIHGGV